MQETINLSSLMKQDVQACSEETGKCEVTETEPKNENYECDPETGECWYVENP